MARSKTIRTKRERRVLEEAQAVKAATPRDPALPDPNDWDAIEHYVVERPHLSLYKLSRELGIAWSPFYLELKKRGITEKRDAFVEQIIRDARGRMAHDVAERVATGVLEFYDQVKELRKALFDAQIARARWKVRTLESWSNEDGGRAIEKRLVTERPGLGADGKPNGTVQRVEALYRDPNEDVRLIELLAKLETELEDKLLGLRPILGVQGAPHDGGYGHTTPSRFKELRRDVEQAVHDAALTYDARTLVIPASVGSGALPGAAPAVAVVAVVGEPAEEDGDAGHEEES